jgi:hypothetical protein
MGNECELLNEILVAIERFGGMDSFGQGKGDPVGRAGSETCALLAYEAGGMFAIDNSRDGRVAGSCGA